MTGLHPSLPAAAVAESIRLVLGAAGIEFENEYIGEAASMKQDLDTYPFGQCPR